MERKVMARYPLGSESEFESQTDELNHVVLQTKCEFSLILGYITVVAAFKVPCLHTSTPPLLLSIEFPPLSVCSRPDSLSTHEMLFVQVLYTPLSRSFSAHSPSPLDFVRVAHTPLHVACSYTRIAIGRLSRIDEVHFDPRRTRRRRRCGWGDRK